MGAPARSGLACCPPLRGATGAPGPESRSADRARGHGSIEHCEGADPQASNRDQIPTVPGEGRVWVASKTSDPDPHARPGDQLRTIAGGVAALLSPGTVRIGSPDAFWGSAGQERASGAAEF